MEKFGNLSYDEENRGSAMEAIHRQPQKKWRLPMNLQRIFILIAAAVLTAAFGQYYFRKRNFYLKHWPHVCPSPWPSYIH